MNSPGPRATDDRDSRSEPTNAEPGSESVFDRVVLIYNPSSTGDAPRLAQELQDELSARLPGLEVVQRPTERAGHARELAREAALQGHPLIISVSGDGGYNEVVNGVMDAGNRRATCAVEAAGNANDHRRVTQERALVDAVAAGEIVRMDLLRLHVTDTLGAHARYAHSYIGVGLTPVVAVDLEKGSKGSLREIVSVVSTFRRFRPFDIQLTDGSRITIDSMLFANIPEMAKIATLSENGDPDDGRFEVLTILHQPKWRVLGTLLKAITRGLGVQPTAREYRFTALKPMPLQVDGEVVEVRAGGDVLVEIVGGAVGTIR